MVPLMSKLRTVFRGSLTLRPLIPATAGLGLLVVVFLAQAHVSYVRWLELTRRDNWHTELRVDFGSRRSWQTSFRPIVSRAHAVWLTLRAPLQGDLAAYRGKEKSVVPAVAKRWLAGKEFSLSWQILSEGQVLATGAASSADLQAWARRDHVRFQRAWSLPILEAAKPYTFVAQVEQANPAVNELSPTLLVRTWGSLKGYGLLGAWRLWHTLFFGAIGIALLVVAYLGRAHARRAACSAAKSDAAPPETEGIRT